MRRDLENTGKETLRAVAFFAAAMFTQDFDQVVLPPKSHILGTPNREDRICALRSHVRAAISLATSLVSAHSDSPNA
jgi:hypothetical protein